MTYWADGTKYKTFEEQEAERRAWRGRLFSFVTGAATLAALVFATAFFMSF